MKKTLVLFTTLFLILLASPSELKAQCPANADSNPCFSLPSGSCVCYPSGKYRFWIAVQVISEAKPTMDQEFNYSFHEYIKAYYQTNQLSISYLGGSWANGQSFRAEMGECSVIILVGDF